MDIDQVGRGVAGRQAVLGVEKCVGPLVVAGRGRRSVTDHAGGERGRRRRALMGDHAAVGKAGRDDSGTDGEEDGKQPARLVWIGLHLHDPIVESRRSRSNRPVPRSRLGEIPDRKRRRPM
ncbi:MAG TPA: hypothetical protein VM305_10140 [Candidatus Limnocylindrales bacterium]|nr:hypothetical protein [Candidatus Limnocylindrales bacterium]